MDSKELARSLEKFRRACESKGFPLKKIWAVEALPGVIGTSYNVKIIADWAWDVGYSKSLDILIDIFWETFPEKERGFVFAFFLNPKETPPNGLADELEKSKALQPA